MTHDKAAVRKLLDQAKAAGREALTAPEARGICEAYGIAIPQEGVATNAADAAALAEPHRLSGGHEDRLAADPAQDRSRRRRGRRASRAERRGRPSPPSSPMRARYDAKAEIDGVQIQQMLQRRPGSHHRRGHRSGLRQAGGLRARRHPGRGAEGHHLPPGARLPRGRAVDARRHRRRRDPARRARRQGRWTATRSRR